MTRQNVSDSKTEQVVVTVRRNESNVTPTLTIFTLENKYCR